MTIRRAVRAAAVRRRRRGLPAAVPSLCRHQGDRRAARPRLRAPGRARPDVPRLHRRRPLRGVADSAAITSSSPARCWATRTRRARPHSRRPSWPSTARDAVRRFFNAPEDEFEIVFTANASGALKLVGEAYPFAPGGGLPAQLRQPQLGERDPRVRLPQGRHGDVHPGARGGPAARRGKVRTALRGAGAAGARAGAPGPAKLFAYPAQSNFSGAQHPLEWVAEAQGLGWDVILDCAAFAPTNPLDAQRDRRRLHPGLLLQALRVSDRQRLSDRAPRGPGPPAPAVVRRRHHHAGLRAAGGLVPPRPGSTGFEDGTIDYLGSAGRHHRRSSISRPSAWSSSTVASAPGLLAAGGARRASPQRRLAARQGLRTGRRRVPRRHHRAVPGRPGRAAL